MFNNNLVLSTDSYKVTHWSQFPEGTSSTYYYTESRGGEYQTITVAGLIFLAEMLNGRITAEDVEEAKKLYDAHFGQDVFNYDGFMRIVNELDGVLPLRLTGLPEGTRIPTGFPIAALQETHPDFAWLPGYFETIKLRAIWYPTTVATIAHHIRDVIEEYMDMTSSLEGEERDFVVNTRLHDFGARGATVGAASAVGGYAHQLLFNGTDNVEAMHFINQFFELDGAPSVSIPAREHSTTTIFDVEDDAFMNSIEQFGKGPFACVMDSYDFEAAVQRCCEDPIKSKLLEAGGTFVFRPDSGNMLDNIKFALETLGKGFGYEYNDKGYKVLHPSVRIIQGDGIDNADTVRRVLSWMETHKWSAENIVFGMGGGLLQKADRDTQKFATKLSQAIVNGEVKDVRKNPKDAPWKASKSGDVRSYFNNGQWEVVTGDSEDDFITYYEDGYVFFEDFNKVRERARK